MHQDGPRYKSGSSWRLQFFTVWRWHNRLQSLCQVLRNTVSPHQKDKKISFHYHWVELFLSCESLLYSLIISLFTVHSDLGSVSLNSWKFLGEVTPMRMFVCAHDRSHQVQYKLSRFLLEFAELLNLDLLLGQHPLRSWTRRCRCGPQAYCCNA